jgi:hypothetical protein
MFSPPLGEDTEKIMDRQTLSVEDINFVPQVVRAAQERAQNEKVKAQISKAASRQPRSSRPSLLLRVLVLALVGLIGYGGYAAIMSSYRVWQVTTPADHVDRYRSLDGMVHVPARHHIEGDSIVPN